MDGHRVHFKIVEADTEKDNVKAVNGKERRFVYRNLTAGDTEDTENLIFNFEYRSKKELSRTIKSG